MDLQSIRFTSIDGRRVAYATTGEGPPLIIGGWWLSHLELDWRDPLFRSFVGALGRYRTVVRYDRPGTGLSEGGGTTPVDIDAEASVLAGVAEALGDDAVDLFGVSAGGPVTAAYVAANAGRVGRLVIYGSYASGGEIANPDAGVPDLLRKHWGVGSRVLADIFMPGATGEERAAFGAFQRESATAEIAAGSLEAVYGLDVRDRLAQVTTPTLVLHRSDDRAVPFDLGRDLAASIPGATFVALQGSEHFPWRGDSAALARVILEGLGIEDPEVDIPVPEQINPNDARSDLVETDLSPRELEVLRLVASGLSDREIADQLVLSPHTIHRHVANIRTKLRLPSRAAAAAHAARLGLL